MKKIYVLISVCVLSLFVFSQNSFGALILRINGKTQAAIVNDTVCAGINFNYRVTITSIPPGVWTNPTPRWTGSGAGFIDNVDADDVNFNCGIPGTYVITYTATQGSNVSITKTIVVKPKDNLNLVLPASSPFDVCEGSTVTFQASDALDYFWQRDDGSATYPIAIGTGSSMIETPPGLGNLKYRVYGVSLGGCSTNPEYIDFEVKVDQAPIANHGGPYTTCFGTSIGLNGSIGGSATSAQWIGGAGTFTPDRNTLNATYAPTLAESGTSVSLTLRTDDPAGICNYAEAITTLTVNPLPAAITGTTNVCVGLTTTLANATSGGSWSSATPAVAIIDAGGVVTAVSAGTSVISYTLPTGCFVTTTVTVNPLPSPITGTTDVCVSSTTLLSNATPGGTWSSATPAVANISAGGLVTGISAGTSVISYTLPTGCKEDVTVTVNPLPAAITGTLVVCAGSTTTLANATPGGTWSSATPAVATIDASGVVTGVSGGTSVISYTLPTGCSSMATVTVNPLPAVITGTTTVCVSMTTTLSNATPGGTWISATPAVATIDAGGIVTGVSAGTSVISYTLPTGCSRSVLVTVNSMPSPITGTTSICLGGTTALANVTPGGVWSSATPAVATIDIAGVVSSVSTGTSVISYTLGSGCATSVTVTVNPLPAAITGTTNVCVGFTTTLSCVTPGGTWSSATPARATVNASGVVTGVSSGTSVISYTLPTGCASTTTVTVNPIPAAIVGTVNFCIGSTTTLTNATPGGTWSSTIPAVATIDAAGLVTGVSAGVTTIRYTLPTGCLRGRNVTVVALPTITLAAVPAPPICQDVTSFSLIYTAITGAPTTYSISAGIPALPGFVPVLNAAFVASPLIIPIPGGSAAGTYQFAITVRNATGCVSIPVNFNLTINPIPAAITGITSVCIGSTTLLANTTPGGTWSSATPAVATISAGGLITGVSAGTSIISYTLVTGCKVTTTITVNPLPTAIGGTTNVCIGSTTSLTNATPGGTWSSATPAVATIDIGGNVTGISAGTSIISYTLGTGCAVTTTVTVNPLPTITLGVISIACQNSNSFNLPYSATTGAPTSYSISAGAPALAGFVPIVDAAMIATPLIIPIPSNSAVGTYQFTITVKNANGCVSTSQNFDLTINTIPVVTFGGVLANQCANATTYLLAGGTPVGGAYTGPGVVGTNFNASIAGVGTHTITYTYSDGTCSNFATNTITVNPIITGNTISTAIPSICYNANAALTGLLPTGGNGTYTYKWQSSTAGVAGPFTDIADINSTNQNYTSVAGITQDTWYRRLVSSGPCINDISNVIQITVGPIFTVGTTFTTPKCVGSNDGTATAIPVGGIPIPPLNTYTYSWDTSPIQITQTATGLIAGTYTVTVTDNIGCTAVGTAIVTDPTPLTLGLPTVVHVTGCFGGNNGSIQIQAAGGTSPYKYDLYNNGAFVATQTVAGPVTFTQPTTPITASTQYEIRVTDANGCGPVLSGNITVNQPIAVDFTYTKLDVSCNASLTGEIHFTPSGGTPPYQYSVDDGFTWGNDPNVLTLAAGNYDLKVRDVNLCESPSKPEEIFESEQIITNGGTWNNITSCFNDNKGEINVIVLGGGIPPYQFSIDAGANWQGTGLFQNLYAGNYTIIVRDAAGCTVNVGPIPITQPTQITFTETVTNVTTCWNNLNGSIRVNTAAGGKSPRTASIDDLTYYTIPHLFPSLGIGNHIIYVKDNNGCKVTKSIPITGPTPITLDAPPTVTGLSCNGVIPPDGSIDLTASGGAVGALTYSIDGGAPQANGNFTLVSGGDHNVRITDILGCFLDVLVNVPEPPAIVFTTEEKTDITCFGVPADGTITLLASGGIGALTYTLNTLNPLNPNNGAIRTPGAGIPAIFSGLIADTYSYLVTDANGCNQPPTGLPFVLIEPAAISITAQTSDDMDCFGGTGSISVDATGGTTPLVYNLYDNTPALVTSNGDGEFTIAVAGTYTVEVTDLNSCGPQIAGPFTINQPAAIIIDSQVFTQMTGVGTNDGTITILASGGVGALHYTLTTLNPLNPMAGTTLTPGAGLPALFTSLSADTYTVIVTDDVPCSIPAPPVVIGQLNLTLTPTQITCNGLDDGQILLTIIGGTGPYTITWSNSVGPLPAYNDLLTIGPLGPETYTVNVVDATGIPGGPNTEIIVEPAVFDASVLSINDKQCFGAVNGSVTFNIVGGSAPYTISWTEGGTPRTEIVNAPPFTATNVLPGTYSFTVTSAGTCGSETISDVTLADPAQLIITDIDWNNPCFGQINGSIIVTASGGTAPLTYSISGTLNATNSDGIFNNLPAGNYTVSLTDDNSCPESHDASISLVGTLTENPEIKITVDPPVSLPCSHDLGTINIDVTGGSPIIPGNTYNYSWSTIPIVTTQDLTGVGSGTYSVTVTDAIGCSNSATESISAPAPMFITDTTITKATCLEIKLDGVETGSIRIENVIGGTVSVPGSYKYSWKDIATIGPYLNGLSYGDYIFIIEDDNDCIYSDTLKVPLKPGYDIHANITGYDIDGNEVEDIILCGSSNVELFATHKNTPPLTYNYNWYKVTESGASGAPLGTQSTFNVFLTEKTQYYIEITNKDIIGEQCLSRDTVTVDVYPKIGLSLPHYIKGLEQDTIISLIYGTSLNLDAITASTAYPTTFKWTPTILFGADSISWNSSALITEEIYAQLPKVPLKQNPAINRLTDFIKIRILAKTSKGCQDSLFVYAKILTNTNVGNVFSPNGDGTNDVWTVPKQYFFPDLSIEIFNRWGALVWSASGDKAVKGWDGRTNNGKELPIGTYYYIVKYNIKTSDGNWKPETGSITIVR